MEAVPLKQGANMPACFVDEFNKAKTACAGYSGDTLWDDCMERYFMPNTIYGTVRPAGHTSWQPSAFTQYECSVRSQIVICSSPSDSRCRLGSACNWWGGTFYLDQNCNSTQPSGPMAAGCQSEFDWRASPISLVWHGSADLEQKMTVVNFPLDPAAEKKWHLWKASADAPLLVFDPAHSGKITAGSQLFGEWAFGGKKFASAEVPAAPDSKWQNGFEALATLDTNHDGEISGRELDPLALWFDVNRDGVSQPGEVKAITKAGVTKLFYRADKTDPLTHSIIANLGFERTEGSKRIQGALVDWYADGADTAAELLGRLALKSLSCESDETRTRMFDIESQLPRPISDASATAKAAHSLNGLWRWTATRGNFEGQPAPGGFFTFSQSADGTVSGHSYGAYPGFTSSGGSGSIVSLSRLDGKLQTGNGAELIEFTVHTGPSTNLRSSAQLSSDGGTLSGNSSAEINYAGRKMTLTYSWVATREAER